MFQQWKASAVLSWLICALLIYVGSYLWFLRAHTHYSLGSPIPLTDFAVGTSDSALLVLFYPAICITDRFGGLRMFTLTDASGEPLPGKHMYPFSEFVTHSSSSPTPSPTPVPDA